MLHTPDMMIRPLIYDALSGEFRPPSDPMKRTHTLGRLAFASAEKGDEVFDIEPEAIDRGIRAYRYIPSWAQDLGSTVLLDESGRYPILSSLRMLANHPDWLEVVDLANPNITKIELKPSKITLPLSLGDDLIIAREIVAGAAQAFFDRVEK